MGIRLIVIHKKLLIYILNQHFASVGEKLASKIPPSGDHRDFLKKRNLQRGSPWQHAVPCLLVTSFASFQSCDQANKSSNCAH